MGIYGNQLMSNNTKSSETLFSEYNSIIEEYFNYSNLFCNIIVNESELISINESKFTEIIKSICKKIKDGIVEAIKKIKQIGANFIQKIKSKNFEKTVNDFTKDNNKRENVKSTPESKKEEEKEKRVYSISKDESKEKDDIIRNAMRKDVEKNNIRGNRFIKDEDTKDLNNNFSLMVIQSKNIFINDRIFENWIDFEKISEMLYPVDERIARNYLNSIFGLQKHLDGRMTAGEKSNAISFALDLDFFKDDYDEEEDFNATRKINKVGEEKFFSKYDDTISTMFPGILHMNPRLFNSGDGFDLETYKSKLDSLTKEYIKPVNITSKDIHENYKKYIYEKPYTSFSNNWFNQTINRYTNFLNTILKQVEYAQNVLEKMIDEGIEYKEKVNSPRGTEEISINTSMYSKYLSKLSKFCSTIISGLGYLLQTQIKYLNMEMKQIISVTRFYNSCFV